jgi:hypothetical protein
MTDATDRSPAFELKVTARAREATFRKVCDVTWRTKGAGHVERTGRRDGLPSPVLAHTRYTDVHVSTHINAWLTKPDLRAGEAPK